MLTSAAGLFEKASGPGKNSEGRPPKPVCLGGNFPSHRCHCCVLFTNENAELTAEHRDRLPVITAEW